MALLTRLSRLVAADAHAVLDALEEPHVMLAAALRDMEHALAAERSTAAALDQELTQLQRRCTQLDAGINELNSQLDLALGTADTSLARELVRRKLTITRQRRTADDLVTARREARTECRQRHAAHQARFEALQQQVLLNRRMTSAAVSPHDAHGHNLQLLAEVVTDADIDIGVLAERQARQPS